MPKKIKYKPPRRRSGKRVYKARIRPSSSSGSVKAERAEKILKSIFGTVAVILLVFLGYSIGAPIYRYFSERDASADPPSESAWTPPVSETTDTEDAAAQTETPAPVTEQVSETSSKSLPAENEKIMAYRLSENVYNDVEVLKSELKLIRTSGFTSAVITLKDENGCFNYNTLTPYADIISAGNKKSLLTAEDIANAFTDCGLVPIAKISVLKDSAYYGAGSGLSYETESGAVWTDKNGKPWLSPYSRETSDFVSQITGELADAGFRYIICTDIVFPELEKEDYAQIGDALAFRDRYTALVKIANAAYTAAEEHGAEMIPEVSFGGVRDGTDEVFHPDELRCRRVAVLCGEDNVTDLRPDSPEFAGIGTVPCYKGGDPDSALRTFAEKGFSDSIVY